MAAETENTLWVGFRPGVDHAALFPVYQMRTFGEPIWPFEINTAETADEREAPTRWFARIVEKAGLEQPVSITINGKAAPQIELLTRATPNGDRLMFLINHDLEHNGTYTLSGPVLKQIQAIADVRAGKQLVIDAAGTVTVDIPAGSVVLLAAGGEAFVAGRIEAQKRVPATIPPMPTLVEAENAAP